MQLLAKIFFVLASASICTPFPSPDTASSRIVNGFDLDVTKVPYQAKLQRRVSSGYSHLCGGSVISSKTILTAAHCVESFLYSPSSIRVVVGTSYRLSGGTAYEVSSIKSHESYNSETLQHDIAVVITQWHITFSSQVRSVAIASPNIVLPTGTESIVTGFGNTAFKGTASDVLLGAYVKVVDQATCARAYFRIATISSGMLCAAGSNPARDACQGDSGGPLVVNNTQIGIVSWGEGCAQESYPGIYTRVSEYYNWIVNASA